MATIVTRAGKGSPLTHNEVDANFTNLNSDKIESGDTVASLTLTAVDVADKITHTGDTDTSIRFPAADTVTVETNGSERMRIDSSGNVGIGTNSPVRPLDVIYSNTSFGAGIRVRNGATTGNNWGRIDIENASQVNSLALSLLPNGDAQLNNRNSAALSFNTTNLERMRIDSSGNVGIGTSSPSEALEVNGTVKATNVSDGSLSIPTTYVTNGSAKAWWNLNGGGTIATRDSYNVSSATDNGTGDYTLNLTSAMSDANYVYGHTSDFTAGAGSLNTLVLANLETQAAGSLRLINVNTAGGTGDTSYEYRVIHGDLAS
jgi:hypothetical protein